MLEADQVDSATRVAADTRSVDAPTERVRALTPAELAWAALLPCALIAVAAILLLGPALGHALFRPSADALWPPTWWEAQGQPEPVEREALVVEADTAMYRAKEAGRNGYAIGAADGGPATPATADVA